MRLPRAQLTVWRLMLVVAVVAMVQWGDILRRRARDYRIRADEYAILARNPSRMAESVEFRIARTKRPDEEPRYERWVRERAAYRQEAAYWTEMERRCLRGAERPWVTVAVGPRETSVRLDYGDGSDDRP
jgi:hypothetical protein